MELKSQMVSVNKSKLIIHIDNNWSSIEFLKLFEAITCLYDYNFLLERAINSYNLKGDDLNWSQSLNSLPEVRYHRESFTKSAITILNNSAEYSLEDALMSVGGEYLITLQVNKIKFGSRGNIDLIGLGKVFEIIRDLIIHYLPNKNQKLENELREQEVISAKIENLKNMGFSNLEVQTLIGLESYQVGKINKLITDNKIIDFEVSEEQVN